MDKAALLVEVQEFLSLPVPLTNKGAYFLDLQMLYYNITGRKCRNVPKMLWQLQQFVKQNEVKEEQLKVNLAMSTTKYQFTKAAVENGATQIVLQNPTELVTPKNLTDATAERILKIKGLKHNIELKPSAAKAETEQDESKTASKTRKTSTKEENDTDKA